MRPTAWQLKGLRYQLATIVLLTLSGCAAPAEPPATASESSLPPSPPSGTPPVHPKPVEVLPQPSKNLAAYVTKTGNVSFILDLDYGADNQCTLLLAGSSRRDGTDNATLALIGRGPGGSTTSMMAMGISATHFHSHGVDTATLNRATNENGSSRFELGSHRRGQWTLLVGGRNLAPHADSFVPDPANQTLYFGLECSNAFALKGARATQDVLFFVQQAARGGTGAHVGVPPPRQVGVPARTEFLVVSAGDRVALNIPFGDAALAFILTPGHGDIRLQQAGAEKARWNAELVSPVTHLGTLEPSSYNLTFNGAFHGGTRGLVVWFDPNKAVSELLTMSRAPP